MRCVCGYAALFLCALGVLSGCQRVNVPGLSFEAAGGWITEEPGSPARVAEYRLPGRTGSDDDARLVIYYFGVSGAGTIESNVQRWCGQFEQPDGRASSDVVVISQRTIHGLQVNAVDLDGTYVAETSPGSGEHVNQPDHRMLAAVVSTDAGPYYVKLVGPVATVARWESSYDRFLSSLRRGQGTEAGADHP